MPSIATGQLNCGVERGRTGRILEDHARWFARLAGQLTPQQIAQAFESAGASPADVEGYQQKLLDKIAELKAAVASLPAESARRDEPRPDGSVNRENDAIC